MPEVAGRGEFARRGGIVDVFPAGQPLPVRIEWFGDEIESLRAFDPANQRGVRAVDSVELLPASEFLIGANAGGQLRESLGKSADKLPADLATDLARLEQGQLGGCGRGVGRSPGANEWPRPSRGRDLGARRA